MTAPGAQTETLPRESRLVAGFKALLYAVGLALYLTPLSSLPGVAAAVVLGLLGMVLAGVAHRRRLRTAVVLGLVPLAVAGALLLGGWAVDGHPLASSLGIRQTLVVADVLTFGFGALAVVFLLRLLAHRWRAASLLEVLFVAGSAVMLLADHRNRMLNRPRAFSDWIWSLGLDPSVVLAGVGVGVTVIAVFLFLRGQRVLKLVTTLVLLLALGGAYFLFGTTRIKMAGATDALGLSGKGKDGKGGKGGGGGGASSKNPFKDNYDNKQPPTPVAIAILRDDFAPRNQLLYFRQAVLSEYNGHHLVGAKQGDLDADVISEFPRDRLLRAAPAQSNRDHTPVPSTMYLLVDHPQPPGLAHPVSYKAVANPNPQQFVAAYDVRSLALTVPTERLLGRRSVPRGWPAARRRHYTALPEDPRYRALADIIVREVDPRFENDDLARAYAIKRYLEREGFYTLKSTHSSRKDPTASFLFGSLRGYCVHFAHAAAYLMRSQGIAARVALGYAVQTTKRGGGSSVLIMGDRAHAWPEIHLDGIGWVTFDIHPERTDMPPPNMVDYDLEKLLGELARKDRTAGLSPDGQPLVIPWAAIGQGFMLLLGGLLALAYLVKAWRRLAPRVRRGRAYPRLAYVALLDRLSDLGRQRRRGETRERHAARLAPLAPHLGQLTRDHLSRALGAGRGGDPGAFRALLSRVDRELKDNVHPLRRALGTLNPIGWMLTR